MFGSLSHKVWRLLTCFLFFGYLGFNFLFNMVFLYPLQCNYFIDGDSLLLCVCVCVCVLCTGMCIQLNTDPVKFIEYQVILIFGRIERGEGRAVG